MPRVQKKLDRQIKRYLSDKNDFLEDIEALKNHLARNPDIQESYIKILSGFPDFFSSVTKSYYDYEDKTKMALHNLNISSKELNELNATLETLNSSLNAVLESLGSALLFFNQEGTCSPIHSKSCTTTLGIKPGHKKIWTILNLKQKEKEEFQSLIKFAFSNESAMTFEDIFNMASKKMKSINGKYISVEYRPIYGSNAKLENILVIADDKTQEEEIKKRLEEKEKQSEKILRTVFAKNDYKRILNQTKEYFLTPEPKFKKEKTVADMTNEIHTLKGLTSSFHINELSNILHKLEYALNENDTDLENAKKEINNIVPSIKSCLETERKNIETLLGKDFIKDTETIEIDKKDLNEFYELLKDDEKIANRFFQSFLTTPIFDTLCTLNVHAQQTAKNLGKNIKPIIFKGENFLLPSKNYQPLTDSFVHLIRNAIDHSLETPEERTKSGKPAQASLFITTKTYNTQGKKWAQIAFSDDGKGLNIPAIKRSLKNKGIKTDNMNSKEIAQTIFEQKISSKETVSQTSGRGVGLNAVKNKAESLGGNIKIEQSKNTTFIVSFPLEINGK